LSFEKFKICLLVSVWGKKEPREELSTPENVQEM